VEGLKAAARERAQCRVEREVTAFPRRRGTGAGGARKVFAKPAEGSVRCQQRQNTCK